VGKRIDADFRSGIRAGVATTPTQFVGGKPHPGVPDADFEAALLGRLR
jgi:protein-disulfide isomerase